MTKRQDFGNIVFIPILNLPELMTANEEILPLNLYGSEDEEVKYNPQRVLLNLEAITAISLKPSINIIKEYDQKKEMLYPLLCNAMIDTGAQRSAVRQSVFDGREWKNVLNFYKKGSYWPVGKRKKIATNVKLSIHIDNIFPGNIFMDICPIVTEWHDLPNTLAANKYDFIIGRDILQYCTFYYDGRKKYFTLTFDHKSQ